MYFAKYYKVLYLFIEIINLMGFTLNSFDLKLKTLPWELKCVFRLVLQPVKRFTVRSRWGKIYL